MNWLSLKGRQRAGATDKQSDTIENAQLTLDKRTLYALAGMLLLSQFPHILHLPLWVSAFGMAIVLLKVFEFHKPDTAFRFLLSPLGMTVIAVGGAMLVRMHYGYFMGRDPCVAFLFILVSAKFAEIKKSSDATLLLCLAGFLLLTQYFYSQSILSALITLPAVLALGNALAVIRDSEHAPQTKQNIKMVCKLLLQGAPLAALLFVVFPRLPGPLWSLPNDASATTGLSDSMSPGSIGSLSKSDEVAFRVEFEGALPPPEARYWRGPVLSDFDGKSWTLKRNSLRVQPRVSNSSGATQYTVTMQATNHNWLFALDHPLSLPMSDTANPADSRPLATLTTDLQLKTKDPIKRVLRYKQSSSLNHSYRSPTKPNILLTQLAGKNPKTVEFAHELRSRSASDSDYINAVLSHFRQQPFHYTLQPSLLGDSPVDEFLFSTRNGFCEHYSSAFVTLMRAAAIPARVVTGYLGGEMNGDYMIVRQSDAHAWAEVFVNGRWTRFDPTGAVAPSRVNNNMAAALGSGEPVPLMARQGSSWLKALKLRIDDMNHDWQRLVVNFNNESQYRLWEKLGLPKLELWQITSIVLALTALWCLAVLGLPGMRRSKLSLNDKLWHQYLEILARHDIKPAVSETSSQIVVRASAALPGNKSVSQLGNKLVRLRFEKLKGDEIKLLQTEIRRELNTLRVSSRFSGRPRPVAIS